MALTALEMFNKIENTSANRKKILINSYIGTNVVWRVYFRSAYQFNKSIYRASFQSKKSSLYPKIICSVNIEKYPQFRFLEEGVEIMVSGKIKEINSVSVMLEKVIIVFTNSLINEKISKKQKSYTLPVIKKAIAALISLPAIIFGGKSLNGNINIQSVKNVGNNGIIMQSNDAVSGDKNVSNDIVNGDKNVNIVVNNNGNSLSSLKNITATQTGETISSLPDFVYGYSSANKIVSYSNPNKFNKLVMEKPSISEDQKSVFFEIQKISNSETYLIGYVNDDVYSRRAEPGYLNNILIMLTPKKWGQLINKVAIPFKNIKNLDMSTKSLGAGDSIDILKVKTDTIIEPKNFGVE